MNYGDFSIYHSKDHCLVTHTRGSKGISFLDDKTARQRQALNRCVENLYKYRFLKPDEIINAFLLEPRYNEYAKRMKK